MIHLLQHLKFLIIHSRLFIYLADRLGAFRSPLFFFFFLHLLWFIFFPFIAYWLCGESQEAWASLFFFEFFIALFLVFGWLDLSLQDRFADFCLRCIAQPFRQLQRGLAFLALALFLMAWCSFFFMAAQWLLTTPLMTFLYAYDQLFIVPPTIDHRSSDLYFPIEPNHADMQFSQWMGFIYAFTIFFWLLLPTFFRHFFLPRPEFISFPWKNFFLDCLNRRFFSAFDVLKLGFLRVLWFFYLFILFCLWSLFFHAFAHDCVEAIYLFDMDWYLLRQYRILWWNFVALLIDVDVKEGLSQIHWLVPLDLYLRILPLIEYFYLREESYLFLFPFFALLLSFYLFLISRGAHKGLLPLFYALPILGLNFLLALFHSFRHLASNIIFFSQRHVYSSPSYTGVLRNRFPRYYRRLLRTYYHKSFNKKRWARAYRRSYLRFVWFFFSFFFRAFFLLPRLFLKFLFLRASNFFNGTLNSEINMLFLLYHRILYRFYSFFWIPLKEAFLVFLYRIYITLRRFFYYLSVNDPMAPFHSLFEEKNKGARERQTVYDNHEMNWSYVKAAPLSLPDPRPSIVNFVGKLLHLSPLFRLQLLPGLFFLWFSFSLSLLLRSFLLIIWIPLAIIFNFLLFFSKRCGFSWLYLSIFLKMQSSLSLLLAFDGSRFFDLCFNFFLHLLRILKPFFTFLPFVLYFLLWYALQTLAYLPLWGFRAIRFVASFLWNYLAFLLLCGAILYFGPSLFLFIAQVIEGYLSQNYVADPSYSNDFIPMLLAETGMNSNWMERAYTSFSHWDHVLYHYLRGPRATINVHKQELLWRKYYRIVNRRDGWTHRSYMDAAVALYGDGLRFFPPARDRLDPLIRIQPAFYQYYKLIAMTEFSSKPYLLEVMRPYLFTYRLLYWTTLYIEFPYIYLSSTIRWLINFVTSQLYAWSDFPFIGWIVWCYWSYYYLLTLTIFAPLYLIYRLLSPLFFSFLQMLYNSSFSFLFESLKEAYHSFGNYLQSNASMAAPGDKALYVLLLWKLWEAQFPFSSNPAQCVVDSIFALRDFFLYYASDIWKMIFPGLEPHPLPHLWLYFYWLLFLEKLSDTANIYWQIPKKIVGKYDLWAHTYSRLGHESRNANFYHRGMYPPRKGLWSPDFSFSSNLSTLLPYLYWENRPRTLAYGAEIKPGVGRWTKVWNLIFNGRGMSFWKPLIEKKFYTYPLTPHLGYLSSPAGPFYYLGAHQDWRLIKWSFSHVAIYFPVFLCLICCASSFRYLFFPHSIEGGFSAYWSAFLHDKDMRSIAKLAMPGDPVLALKPGQSWSNKLIVSARQHILSWGTHLIQFRQSELRQSFSFLWESFPETMATSSLAKRYRRLRQRKLWPYPLEVSAGQSAVTTRKFFYSLYAYVLLDLKLLPMFRQLEQAKYFQPHRFWALRKFLPLVGDFNLTAALSEVSRSEIEEDIRAEYIFRQRYVNEHYRFLENLKAFLIRADHRIFDHYGSGLAFHLDSFHNYGEWMSHPASHLLQHRLHQFKLTPVIFSRFIQNRSHLFDLLQDTRIYPFVLFWFLLFPFFIFVQGLFSFYAWRLDWSPKKARTAAGEYWLLWIQLFLHFDLVSEAFYYVWAADSWSVHPIRSGSKSSLDDPNRWMRKSWRQEFYVWSILRRWRHQEWIILWKPFQWNRFTFGTLSEQRLLQSLTALFQLCFLLFLMLRLKFLKPHVWYFKKWPKEIWSATFVRQLYYKRVKLQLKKGLLWFWLKM